MIVQSAAEGIKHFVITMSEHTALAVQFAEHFGNDRFEAVEPRELMLYVVRHHDEGWRDLDAAALRDPTTGLPYNLVQTPFERIVEHHVDWEERQKYPAIEAAITHESDDG